MLAAGSASMSFKGCSVEAGVEQWLRLGGRHVDTANDYGTQPDVGRALKASGVPRKEVFLTTKIPGPIGRLAAMELILNTSLPHMGVDYIDLVLIHSPCLAREDQFDKCGDALKGARLETWQGLVELVKAGKIRAAGVSNFNKEQVAEILAAGGRPAVNQVEWHLGYHNEQLLAASKAAGVTLEAWGPLTGPTAGHPGVSLADSRLKTVAARYNASTAQVALRWSAQKGVAAVTGTCDKGHALGDLAAFDFALSEADVALLDGLQAAPAMLIAV